MCRLVLNYSYIYAFIQKIYIYTYKYWEFRKLLYWLLLCGYLDSLELWYNSILVLLTGNLKNAEVALDALAIWYVNHN